MQNMACCLTERSSEPGRGSPGRHGFLDEAAQSTAILKETSVNTKRISKLWRIPMKRNLVATATLAAIGLAMLVTIALPAQAAQCSLANVGGSYGYTTSGFVVIAPGTFVPAAAAGRITLDGQGHVNGTQTRVVAGSSLDETYSGTYSVNPNCTGSFTVMVEPDTRTSTVDVVWTDNTNGAISVFTNPGFILTSTARRISPRETD